MFGEADGVPADFPVELVGTLPALSGVLTVARPIDMELNNKLPPLVGHLHVATVDNAYVAGMLPALTGAIAAVYVSNTQRPIVGAIMGAWQVADSTETGVQAPMQSTTAQPAGVQAQWQEADPVAHTSTAGYNTGDPGVRPSATTQFQKADRLGGAPVASRHQVAARTRRGAKTFFQKADRVRAAGARVRFQEGMRDRRNWTAGHWQKAIAYYVNAKAQFATGWQLDAGWETEFQKAMRPPAGTSAVPPIVVPGDLCYTPPLGDAVHLVFRDPWTDSTDLVFVCENHTTPPEPGATVVVPIKGVYVVLNTSSLRRVDNGKLLPTFNLSLSLDVDSWTWAFSASLPREALPDLQPAAPNEPLLVEATVNGVAYRLLVEKRGSDRTFNNAGVKISGRGLAAQLDSPYAPIMNHMNSEARTAQQLMNDVLTLNGVGIGWDIDWRAVDWSVPAGAFAQQGPYIAALNAIAQAAGSYIQPHPTEAILRVLPRYPDLPWDWASVAPDYEIPAAVATVEGIEWVNKAVYNRVFVHGTGMMGQVTRTGTDGGLVAPMVTEPLVSTAAAARQRATSVLADTGSQADVSLRLPILAETGIIVPGKTVRYVDGATSHRGIVRSTRVDVGTPEIWQTIVLETHVL